MAGPAAERSSPSTPDATDADWRDRLRHQWRRSLLLLAHWRLCVAIARRHLAEALRGAWRYPRNPGDGPDGVPLAGDPNGHLLPSVSRDRSLPTPVEDEDSTVADPSTETALPPTSGSARELPAGDGVLEVERTPDRLILSDPAAEDAYLASTTWVDVEE